MSNFKFEVIEVGDTNVKYSDGCSGGRSDCCTRVCTRNNITSNDDTLEAWDNYLEVNAGVLQY